MFGEAAQVSRNAIILNHFKSDSEDICEYFHDISTSLILQKYLQ